jgi:hypothetical protein
VGYKIDERTPHTPAGTRVAGSGAVPCTSFTPETDEPVPGPGDDLAQTTIDTARSGAIVFDTGTMGWELGLEPVPSASPDAPLASDPRCRRDDPQPDRPRAAALRRIRVTLRAAAVGVRSR